MHRLSAPAGAPASAAGACSTSGRFPVAALASAPSLRPTSALAALAPPHHSSSPRATWSRPTPDRDQDWIKPSYVPGPRTQPDLQPFRQDEPRPLYAPPGPEFSPAERPESPAFAPKEMPKMPERPRDPIPAGNPKERPPGEGGQEGAPAREEPAPPAKK